MIDYLGLKDEEDLKSLLTQQDFKNAKLLIDTVWRERKIAAFGLWKLLLESKSKEALDFRKDHVMARDTVCTSYLCFRFCPDKLEEFLRIPILESEKIDLLNDSLTFAAGANDGDFCKILLDKGADPCHKNYLALRLACQAPNQTALEGLRQGGLSLDANSNYCFKQAFANDHIERLNYLLGHLKRVPIKTQEVLKYINIRNKELLDYRDPKLGSNNFDSLKWLDKNIDYAVDFCPEILMEDYYEQQTMVARDAKTISKRVNKIMDAYSNFSLKRCLKYFREAENNELLKLTQPILKKREQKIALQSHLKNEYKESIETVEI